MGFIEYAGFIKYNHIARRNEVIKVYNTQATKTNVETRVLVPRKKTKGVGSRKREVLDVEQGSG